MIVKLNQEQELWLELPLLSNCCGRTFQPRQGNDLMNYEQKGTSSNQGHEYQQKARFVLITRSTNKIWVQLVLTRVRDNVPRLSIYILNIYFTLLTTQAISMVVAWASSYLAYTPSCLKVVPWHPRHLWSSGLGLKPLGLHSKSTWLVFQAIQRWYPVPQGTATALWQILKSF